MDFEEDFDFNMENANVEDFIHTDEDQTKTVEYKSLTVIDALDLANNAWSNGAPFDADVRVIKDIVDSDPVRIVDMHEVEINGHNMYCVWGLVTVSAVDYPVPIRFYADKNGLDSKVFNWSIERAINQVCLEAIVELFRHKENERWSNLLDV